MAILKNLMILIARRVAIIVFGVAALTGMNGCGSSSGTKAGPIKVTIGNGTTSGQPVSLAARATATVSMNPVNDALGAGVNWTAICLGSPVNGSTSGGACGTFSPAHTADGAPAVFTAPPNVPIVNTVTISAAATGDPSATSSVTATIVSPQIAIAFSTPPPASIQAGQQATLSVLITNDSANAGAALDDELRLDFTARLRIVQQQHRHNDNLHRSGCSPGRPGHNYGNFN